MGTVRPTARRRLETWLWTGPLGHLIGGGLDLCRALAGYLFARARSRSRSSAHDKR